jgi:alpha-beta hydrolase superfamily lysophospholipase
LLGGLWQISGDSAIKSIPATLPILITGGSEDPVGGEKGMSKLAARYARCGHQHLKLKLYAGGRHEMLNEINRDDVSRDWLDWIDATTGSER